MMWGEKEGLEVLDLSYVANTAAAATRVASQTTKPSHSVYKHARAPPRAPYFSPPLKRPSFDSDAQFY